MARCRFSDDAGREIPAVDEAEMREVDRIAIEETGPNLFQMMENAGRNLALEVQAMAGPGWRDRGGRPVRWSLPDAAAS